jgi:hypothetical protein
LNPKHITWFLNSDRVFWHLQVGHLLHPKQTIWFLNSARVFCVRILEELLEWSLSCLVITNGNLTEDAWHIGPVESRQI